MSRWFKYLRRLVRYLFITVFIFVFLSILTVLVLRLSYPPEKWQQLIRTELEKRLNSKVSFGDIDYSFTGGLYVKNFYLHDVPPEDKNDSVMFAAEKIFIRPQLLPLLRREIHISSVALTNSSLNLKKDKTGANWQRLPFFKPQATQEHQATEQATKGGWNFSIVTLPKVKIDSLKITDYAGNVIIVRLANLSGNKQYIDFFLDSAFSQDTAELKANFSLLAPYELATLKSLPQSLRDRSIHFRGSLEFHRFSSPLLPTGINFLNGKIKFANTAENTQLEIQNLTFKHNKLPAMATFNGKVNLTGKTITATNSSLQMGQNIFLKQLSFRYEDTIRSFEAEIDADLPSLATLLRKTGITSGKVLGTLQIKEQAVHANLQFQSVSLQLGNVKLIDNASFSAKMTDNRFEIPQTELNILGQILSFSLSGNTKSQKWYLNYVIRANTLLLPEILQRLRPTTNPSTEPMTTTDTDNRISATNQELPQVYVNGEVYVAKVKYDPIEWQDFHATTEFEPNLLRLKNLKAVFYSGQFTGNYQLALKEATHEFSINFSGLKPNQLFDSANIKARWFTSLNGSLSGSMIGRSSTEFRQSLKARLRIESGSGRLVNSAMQQGFITGVLGPLEDRLSAIEYRRAALEISAADDRLYIRQATFDSEDLALKIMGAAEWNSQADVVAELRFKDSFIRDVANPLQLGIDDVKRGDWYVLPFSCQGKLTDPRCWQKEW